MPRYAKCVKVRYGDETMARNAAQIAVRVRLTLHNEVEAPLRPYRCPKCRGWHLTKNEAAAYWQQIP
jgi:hypothetical protein